MKVNKPFMGCVALNRGERSYFGVLNKAGASRDQEALCRAGRARALGPRALRWERDVGSAGPARGQPWAPLKQRLFTSKKSWLLPGRHV